MNVWFLPCNETPFLNRDHPVFLAIRDRVLGCDDYRILLEHFGWVTYHSCFKTKEEAQEELFHKYEVYWLDQGLPLVAKRSTLFGYFKHLGKPEVMLPWFDLDSVLRDPYAETTD
jgi:hypothetical protein